MQSLAQGADLEGCFPRLPLCGPASVSASWQRSRSASLWKGVLTVALLRARSAQLRLMGASCFAEPLLQVLWQPPLLLPFGKLGVEIQCLPLAPGGFPFRSLRQAEGFRLQPVAWPVARQGVRVWLAGRQPGSPPCCVGLEPGTEAPRQTEERGERLLRNPPSRAKCELSIEEC